MRCATILADMRLLLLPALMLTLVACNQDKIANLEKQNRQLEAKLESVTKAGSLDLQAKCSQQARLAFSESGLGKKAMAGYVNHYNPKLNICFVVFSSTETAGKDLTTYRVLYDAFEGKQYAEYFGGITRDAKPNVCTVKLQSGEDKDCESSKEFDELLKRYME